MTKRDVEPFAEEPWGALWDNTQEMIKIQKRGGGDNPFKTQNCQFDYKFRKCQISE